LPVANRSRLVPACDRVRDLAGTGSTGQINQLSEEGKLLLGWPYRVLAAPLCDCAGRLDGGPEGLLDGDPEGTLVGGPDGTLDGGPDGTLVGVPVPEDPAAELGVAGTVDGGDTLAQKSATVSFLAAASAVSCGK
jgi:hypothetical protein